MLFVFFFFKQKTAYEMRISDWSSDVCSSDLVALVVSLLVSTVTRRHDRRTVFMVLFSLLIASNLFVAAAPSVPLLLAARVLLGIAMGGFWAMSTATVMRLVPQSAIPRPLSMVFGGVAAATIVAAPVGSYLRSEEHTSELQSLMRISYA